MGIAYGAFGGLERPSTGDRKYSLVAVTARYVWNILLHSRPIPAAVVRSGIVGRPMRALADLAPAWLPSAAAGDVAGASSRQRASSGPDHGGFTGLGRPAV